MPALFSLCTRRLWTAAACALATIAWGGVPVARADALPEFSNASPAAWVNSPPLTAAALRGKVVLIEVYTSG